MLEDYISCVISKRYIQPIKEKHTLRQTVSVFWANELNSEVAIAGEQRKKENGMMEGVMGNMRKWTGPFQKTLE